MELFCHRKKGGQFSLEVAKLNWPQATTFEKELEVGKEGGGNTVYLGGDLNWAPAVVAPAHTRNPLPIRQNGQKLHHCHGQPGNQQHQLPCNFSWQQHAAGARCQFGRTTNSLRTDRSLLSVFGPCRCSSELERSFSTCATTRSDLHRVTVCGRPEY